MNIRVLHLGTTDASGGAAAVASQLVRGSRARGYDAWLAVGHKSGDAPFAFEIPDDDRWPYRASGYVALQRWLREQATRAPGAGWGWLGRALRLATHPRAAFDTFAGREDFEFPGTRNLLALAPAPVDLVHCHNLHGGYFDLRSLAWLSRHRPTALTLHDEWLMTGHCGYSFDCGRWRTGCGSCPDLTIDPAIRRDATADNWVRKRDIYAASRLYVASPSRWLLDRVQQSMLAPSVHDARVIPNGVDVSVFRPRPKAEARAAIGLALDRFVVLVTGSGQQAPWRDHRMLDDTLGRLNAALPHLEVVAVGRPGTAPRADRTAVRFDGYQSSPEAMARYYQAADVHLHLAKTDNFPTAVLESLSCGTSVVATAVGGIGEQICNLPVPEIPTATAPASATGVLVSQSDSRSAAEVVIALAQNETCLSALGRNAARDARARFDLERQIASYLEWYSAIIDDWQRHAL